jgi:hypothetical protein
MAAAALREGSGHNGYVVDGADLVKAGLVEERDYIQDWGRPKTC